MFSGFRVASYLAPLESNGYVRGAQLAAEIDQHTLSHEILKSGRIAANTYGNSEQAERLTKDLDILVAYLNEKCGGG